MKMQPEIYALKKVFLHFSQQQQTKIKYYFDLHAHASSRGLFLFGNSLDFLQQIENIMLPKLIELNSEDLIFTNCNFSEKSMKSKDRGDKYSKQGTGRVHFNKVCDIIHCYTVEASYFRGIMKNNLKEIRPIDFNLLLERDKRQGEGDCISHNHNNINYNNWNQFKISSGVIRPGSVGNYFVNFGSNNNTNDAKTGTGGLVFSENRGPDNAKDKFEADDYMISKNADIYNNCHPNANNINEELDNVTAQSDILLKILAKYYKVEIEKAFFGDMKMLKKIVVKQPKNKVIIKSIESKNNYEKEKEKDEYEKIRNINLNINLSFDTLDKSRENADAENNNNDNRTKSSIDNSSLISDESEGKKLNIMNNTNINLNSVKMIKKKNSLAKEKKNFLDDIDDENIVNNEDQLDRSNTIEKYAENEIFKNRRKMKFNSISNFKKIMRLSSSSNNNTVTIQNNLNNDNKAFNSIKETLSSEKSKLP